MTTTADELREQVREHYAASARAVTDGDGCGCGCTPRCSSEGLAETPHAGAAAPPGCGNPTAVAELHEGEVVLDLGSGGGIDVILSAKRGGATGHPAGPATDGGRCAARRPT